MQLDAIVQPRLDRDRDSAAPQLWLSQYRLWLSQNRQNRQSQSRRDRADGTGTADPGRTLVGVPKSRLRSRPGWLMACLFAVGFWQLGQGAWIPAKAWLAQALMSHAWRRAEAGRADTRPWPWADTRPVARLLVRHGEIELIVLEGGSGRTLAFGPGHLSASVLPGDPGNSIIAGHRDTHFQFLQTVQLGDEFAVERSDGRLLRFRVSNIDVVDSRYGSILLDTETPTLTLMTCYPFSAPLPGGPMRYVVTAELEPADPAT